MGCQCWAPMGRGSHLLSLLLDKVKGKCSKVKPPPTGPIHRKVGAAFRAGSRATLGPQGRQEGQGGYLLPSASISWGPGSPEPVVPCICSQCALNLKVNSYSEPPHPSKNPEVDSLVTSTFTLY